MVYWSLTLVLSYSGIINVRRDQCSWEINVHGGSMLVEDQCWWRINVRGGSMFVGDQCSWRINVRGGSMFVEDQCLWGINAMFVDFMGYPYIPTNLHPHEPLTILLGCLAMQKTVTHESICTHEPPKY